MIATSRRGTRTSRCAKSWKSSESSPRPSTKRTGISRSTGLGDVIVTLVCVAEQLGLNIEECCLAAYDEIKDRKGKMIDGVFVKEADLEKMQEHGGE